LVLPELLDIPSASRRGHLDRFGFGPA
jgi:hypothetical protein